MNETTQDPELVRLAKLVKAMRHAQRQFFAGDRSAATVAMAKDLERRVDRAVGWVLEHRQGQNTLFPMGREGGAEGAYGPDRGASLLPGPGRDGQPAG